MPRTRRLTLTIAATATVAAAFAAVVPMASAAPTQATATHPAVQTAAPKPTVVLVHGGFADASNWSGVVQRLEKAGYAVVAPANPLRGIPTDAAYLHSFLKSIKGPIILVGHSYGGAVITNAAADIPNVKALVYVAAFVPDRASSSASSSRSSPAA